MNIPMKKNKDEMSFVETVWFLINQVNKQRQAELLDEFQKTVNKMNGVEQSHVGLGIVSCNGLEIIDKDTLIKLKPFGNNIFQYTGYRSAYDGSPIFKSVTDDCVPSWRNAAIGRHNYIHALLGDIESINNGAGWIKNTNKLP